MRHYRKGKCNKERFTLRSQKNTYDKQFFPCFKSFMINWVNLIKIERAGGNKSNRKDWNL